MKNKEGRNARDFLSKTSEQKVGFGSFRCFPDDVLFRIRILDRPPQENGDHTHKQDIKLGFLSQQQEEIQTVMNCGSNNRYI